MGSTTEFQRETVINLYNSGIPAEIIALQLDMDQQAVDDIITAFIEKTNGAAPPLPEAPVTIYPRTPEQIDQAVRDAQERVWKALRVAPEFSLSTSKAQQVLQGLVKSKVTMVILNIDLVGSTRLATTLPADRIATIIQAFTQEMSTTIVDYGGYPLKYIGDAILAFFIPDNHGDLSVACAHAVDCARTMIRIVREGINQILNQSDYPEISVRIGVDAGENVVVQYGWNDYNAGAKVLRIPHFDILGYTMNIANKMTALAKADQVIIGQMVYELLCSEQQQQFSRLEVSPEMWSYVSGHTGGIYPLYTGR